MKKLKKDIDKGLPKVGNIVDNVYSDLPIKLESFFNSAAKGFENFFSPPFIKKD